MAKSKSTTTRKTTKKKAATRSTSAAKSTAASKTKKAAAPAGAKKKTAAVKAAATKSPAKTKTASASKSSANKVRDVMSTTIGVCHPHSSLADAAQIMWKRDCGFVPVIGMATNTIQGVITDRDIAMSAAISGQSLHQLQVHSAMSHTIQTIRDNLSLSAAHKLMREFQVHRLPVVDADDHVIGVVSLNDLARNAGSDTTARREVGATLGAISQPHPVKMPMKTAAPKKAKIKAEQAGQGQLI